MSIEETRPHKNSGSTRAHRAGEATEPTGTGAEPAPEPRSGNVPWYLLGGLLLVAVVVLGASAGTGYMAGVDQRRSELATAEATGLKEQFDLGVTDLEEGRLEAAKQRFEYILSNDPDYPGARDLLTLAQQGLNEPTTTPSPTATQVTLTPTPTLDPNTLDGLIEAAKAANQREDWTEAIQALLTLRRRDPDYRLDEANQLLFTALRNRGMGKLFRKDLEQGIYDLRLAGLLGTLDNQAQGWIRSAAFYQYANSFFGLDWQEATRNFANLCAAGIWDSCWKYAQSTMKFGDQLYEDEQYCAAVEQYDASLTTRDNLALVPTATAALEACLTATVTPDTPTPTPTGSTTVTPTSDLVTASPTPTSSPTVGSTSTSAPTATEGASATPSFTPTQTPIPTETAEGTTPATPAPE